MSTRLLLITLLFFPLFAIAQLNMSLVSNIQYEAGLNDIWGYVAPDGTEYALVGAVNGVSIVSLADPENAVQVAFVPGQTSTWRDIKTWGEFAYVVTDQPGTTEGLTVIDLTSLPTSVNFNHWTPNIPGLGNLNKCHNIYIDEFGYAYLAGCNINGGGMLYIDVFTTPGVPVYVDKGPTRYAHDVFTRENKMYSSELNNGRMAIYDVSDKSNNIELGVQTTPFEFTHNIWLSDDDNIAFTTDEQGNAPVTAYDVSDPTDIQELDQYRPSTTLNENVVPHNVHTWQNWLIISYYTDGGKIVDATRPDNLVEVGNFDTFFGLGGGTNGVWGAYPFLPSGLVLLTDRGNGLYVLDANYVRACYVEGSVTNAVTDAPLDNVKVSISSVEEPNIDFSGLDGSYGTGIATPGTYEITYSKPGFASFTTSVELMTGEVTLQNAALTPLPIYEFSGVVVDALHNVPIEGARVLLNNGQSIFEAETNADGQFFIPDAYESTYQLFAGAWGFQLLNFEYELNNDSGLTLELTPGYIDDFVLDLGWQSTNSASTRSGMWVLGNPVGTADNGDISNPYFDVEGDIGTSCYITGNGGGSAANDDVDGGRVTLTSPVIDLTEWTPIDENARLAFKYNLWYYNGGGNPIDSFIIRVHNENEEAIVEVITDVSSEWRPTSEIFVEDFIDISDNVWISFSTSDFDPTGNITEAGVDAFRVEGITLTNANEPISNIAWKVLPNPFQNDFRLTLDFLSEFNNGTLKVYDAIGQLIETKDIDNVAETNIELGKDWPAGIYFLQLEVDGKLGETQKVVKQ